VDKNRAGLLALILMLAVSPLHADSRDVVARLRRLNQPVPAEFDTSRVRKTSNLSVSYEAGDLRLRTPQDWILVIKDRQDQPVEGAQVKFTGGMPQHGHSFATDPGIRELGQGRYGVDGIQFQMPGWWAIEVEIVRRDHAKESVRFDLLLETSLDWEENERAQMKRLWIGSLPPLPAQDPKLVALGGAIFSDTSLSRDGKISCAVCHRADRAMTDGRVLDVPSQGPRKVPSLLGAAWQSWFFWDGRKDSLASQALAPIVNKAEYAMTESGFLARVRSKYGRKLTFTGVGQAIAAYETTLAPTPSPFDRFVERKLGLLPSQPYVERPAPFNECAQKGFRVFIGKGRCISCHNGPRFENNAFHNTGVPPLAREQGNGRYSGIKLAKADPYRCKENCGELDHAADGPAWLLSAFKTPSLRNVAITPPYMHNGSLRTLEEVIEHYKAAPTNSNGSELLPLTLSLDDSAGLVCFLKSLTSETLSRP
jgi:cytochrome c peroxidase